MKISMYLRQEEAKLQVHSINMYLLENPHILSVKVSFLIHRL